MQNSQYEDSINRLKIASLKSREVHLEGGISDLWEELVGEEGRAPGLEACKERERNSKKLTKSKPSWVSTTCGYFEVLCKRHLP